MQNVPVDAPTTKSTSISVIAVLLFFSVLYLRQSSSPRLLNDDSFGSFENHDPRSPVQTEPEQRDDRFGLLLHCFGYCKMYRASAREFVSSVPIWHAQRPINAERAHLIAEARKDDLEFRGRVCLWLY